MKNSKLMHIKNLKKWKYEIGELNSINIMKQ